MKLKTIKTYYPLDETRLFFPRLKEKYQIDEQARRQGKYVAFHPDGSLCLLAYFTNDLLNGPFIQRPPNGSYIHSSYREDKLEGLQSTHNCDGSVIECYFVNNNLDGFYTVFKPDHTINWQLYFKQGEEVPPPQNAYPPVKPLIHYKNLSVRRLEKELQLTR